MKLSSIVRALYSSIQCVSVKLVDGSRHKSRIHDCDAV